MKPYSDKWTDAKYALRRASVCEISARRVKFLRGLVDAMEAFEDDTHE